MTWYSAYNLSATILTNAGDEEIYVEERVYLIESHSLDDAERCAGEIGKKDEESGSVGQTVNGRPAREVFLGVRRVQTIYPSANNTRSFDNAIPEHGAEIAYSNFKVANLDVARKMAAGYTVDVVLIGEE